jgi:hypothetical protein
VRRELLVEEENSWEPTWSWSLKSERAIANFDALIVTQQALAARWSATGTSATPEAGVC